METWIVRIVQGVGTAIVVSLIVVSTTACHSEAKQGAPVPGRESATVPAAEKPITPEQAISTGRAWLDALKAKDFQKVAERTRLPFTYSDTSRNKACNGIAADVKKLTVMISCLEKQGNVLLEELGHAERLKLKVIESREVPPSLSKVIEAPKVGDRMVSAFINGDGITFELLLLIAPVVGNSAAAVKAFFVNSEVESG